MANADHPTRSSDTNLLLDTNRSSDSNLSESEWEAQTRRLLSQGEAFHAYDRASAGLTRFPESVRLKQTAARALLRTGAVDEARKILEPLCAGLDVDGDAAPQIYAALRKALQIVSDGGENPPRASLDDLTGLLREIGQLGNRLQQEIIADEETLGILGRVYKDTWKRSGNSADAVRCRDVYLHAFRQTRGYYSGINAATMSWIVGERKVAQDLAAQTLEICDQSHTSADEQEQYWIAATRGEALLLLEREEEALDAYREAAFRAGREFACIVSSLQQLKMMTEHDFPVPAALFSLLRPPAVVVFTGHMIDQPDRKDPRFPPHLEAAVRAEIDRELDRLDARIGYCSGACGGDLIFAEAMIDRDAEVNIVLPFDKDDFIRASVEFAGRRWVSRFHRALKLAHEIRYVTEERYLGDDVLFAFANQIFGAYAELRARTLETAPSLLALWDGKGSGLIGGTADTIDRWPNKSRVEIIRLDEILRARSATGPSKPASATALLTSPAPAPEPGEAPAGIVLNSPPRHPEPGRPESYRRDIKTMLFADVVGYSKLPEEYLPAFMYEFLQRIAQRLQGVEVEPEYLNTWGDAIFAVMSRAVPMTCYALALQEAVCAGNWAELGLPAQMNIRIALHAGPVYAGMDPILRRQNVYGSHVNRAARLEPVTVPGCIYASEQFAALLTEERSAAEQDARRNNEPYEFPYVAEWVGALSLAKNYGSQTIYHIRRKESAP